MRTLPPGILRKQIAANGTLTLGNFTLQVQADVYEAGLNAVQELEKAQIVERPVSYATNNLEIMVRRGNPLNIRSLSDLANHKIRLSMPNPEWEGVARQIAIASKKRGRNARRCGDDGQSEGWLDVPDADSSSADADANSERTIRCRGNLGIGGPVSGTDRQPDRGRRNSAAQNTNATYSAAMLKKAPHREAAAQWLSFLGSGRGPESVRSLRIQGGG